MCKGTGCCGSLIRVILSVINVIFLLIGLTIFITSAVFKWSPSSIVNKVVNDPHLQPLMDLMGNELNAITVVLMIVGGFIILLSLVGLIGAACANRCFLVIYEVIIVLLFLTHTGALLFAVIKSPDLEKRFQKGLNDTMDNLNNPNTASDEAALDCSMFYVLSDVFDCCGANGPDDFKNATLVSTCCVGDEQIGCNERIVSTVKENSVNIVLIPNSIILVFEFIIIIMVPFLIGRIGKGLRRRELEEEGIVNIKPTTYGMPMAPAARTYRY